MLPIFCQFSVSEQSQSVEPGKYQEWRDRHILEAIRNLREFLEQVRESKVDETQESKVDEARVSCQFRLMVMSRRLFC